MAKLSTFTTNHTEIKRKEHDLEIIRLENQMKLDERRLALQEQRMALETKKLEFQMSLQSHSRSGSSSRTPSSSRYSSLNLSNNSSSLSPEDKFEYDSEASLDLKIRQAMQGGSMKQHRLYMAKKLKEIEITNRFRNKCREDFAREPAIIELDNRLDELEYRKERRLKNPIWHTEGIRKIASVRKLLEDPKTGLVTSSIEFDPEFESDPYIKEKAIIQLMINIRETIAPMGYPQARHHTSPCDHRTATCWRSISSTPRLEESSSLKRT